MGGIDISSLMFVCILQRQRPNQRGKWAIIHDAGIFQMVLEYGVWGELVWSLLGCDGRTVRR